jgi:hypothetical protein
MSLTRGFRVVLRIDGGDIHLLDIGTHGDVYR